MSDQTPGALARAVCQVMGAVRYIPETGKNDFHGYRYASDEDLLVAVQPAMAAAGLALIPARVDTRTVEHTPDRKNKAQWRTEITVTYDLLHVSGECRQVQGVGCGIDGEDKGVYKAMTGALKYALRHTFLLPTGDDPERARGRDEDDDRRERERERERDDRRNRDETPRQERRDAPARPTDEEIAARLATANITRDEADWYAATQGPIRKPLSQHTDAELDDALRWFTSSSGAGSVAEALVEVREQFQRAWFAQWNRLYPRPRKSDGADDAAIERAEARSESDRKILFRRWYGADSVHTIPIRPLLKSDHSLGWVRSARPDEFESEVLATLRAAEPAGEAA